jgi:hypothetical protein
MVIKTKSPSDKSKISPFSRNDKENPIPSRPPLEGTNGVMPDPDPASRKRFALEMDPGSEPGMTDKE